MKIKFKDTVWSVLCNYGDEKSTMAFTEFCYGRDCVNCLDKFLPKDKEYSWNIFDQEDGSYISGVSGSIIMLVLEEDYV